MLLYVENLIDFPIPYWNGFAQEAANPTSKFAGIPKAFLEDKYYHPIAKEWRNNPLKYALSADPEPRPVKRDPLLVKGHASLDDRIWTNKIQYYMTLYHRQIAKSLEAETYSFPQGIGFPWANIPTFKEEEPDICYKHRTTFDSLFEQPHDNFHGWLGGIGGDMSDNTKTGFDPLFYSLHCNLDRLFSAYLVQHPNQQYSSNFPLRPFTDGRKVLSYEDPRQYVYTTLGDMVKNTKAMGYIYAPPAAPDAVPLKMQAFSAKPISQGGHGLVTLKVLTAAQAKTKANGASEGKKVPWVVFEDVCCTTESFQINVYLDKQQDGASRDEGTLIAQSTRLGMGLGDVNNGGLKNQTRCKKPTVTRAVEIGEYAKELEENGGKIRLEVQNLSSGKEVDDGEAATWQGFQAKVVWI